VKRSLILFALSCLLTSAAFAQATRTWVSGVGDDVNPCSRTAPCKTFAGAISKTAAGGEISVLDPGGFGGVTITKAMTLDGTSALGSILVAGQNGVLINAGVNDVVTLHKISFMGLNQTANPGLNGIRIINNGAKRVNVDGCYIYNFGQRGISDERTAGGNLSITETVIRDCTLDGVQVSPATGNTTIQVHMNGVTIKGNGGIGFNARAGVRASLDHTDLVMNGTGLSTDQVNGNGVQVNLQNCIMSLNGYGIQTATGAQVRLADVAVQNNTIAGLLIVAGTVFSYGNHNRLDGNAAGNTGFTLIAEQ
jgi:hypothetical protein